MTYFSNNTEGELFKEENCYKCLNWVYDKDSQEEGCPIMDLHLLHSYELYNSRSLAKEMLDFLIPAWEIKDGAAIVPKCSMFLAKENFLTKEAK